MHYPTRLSGRLAYIVAFDIKNTTDFPLVKTDAVSILFVGLSFLCSVHYRPIPCRDIGMYFFGSCGIFQTVTLPKFCFVKMIETNM